LAVPVLYALGQEKPSQRAELRSTMCHESLLSVRSLVFLSLQSAGWPSTVNGPLERTEFVLDRLQGIGNNEEFLTTVKESIQVAAFTEFSP
jgi:hypothetical protein